MLTYHSVDEYIAAQPKELQNKLQKLRKLIRNAAPGAEESISYGMPAYKYLGRPLVYFAAQKAHIGFYALPTAIQIFSEQLSLYQTSKGTIRFPLDQELPLDLVQQIVQFRVEENRTAASVRDLAKMKKSPASATKKPDNRPRRSKP